MIFSYHALFPRKLRAVNIMKSYFFNIAMEIKSIETVNWKHKEQYLMIILTNIFWWAATI